MTPLQRELAGFVSESLVGEPDAIGADDDLLLGGVVDSMGVMRLVAFIEERHGKPVPPEDVTIENFSTVRTIATYLESRGLAPGADGT